MVEFHYNCSMNEATTHSPLEAMYGYRPLTLVDRLLPLSIATTDASDRLTLIADIQNMVNQVLKLSKERMAAR
jgi:hypothetical protein